MIETFFARASSSARLLESLSVLTWSLLGSVHETESIPLTEYFPDSGASDTVD